jgi:hypothetical protein
VSPVAGSALDPVGRWLARPGRGQQPIIANELDF